MSQFMNLKSLIFIGLILSKFFDIKLIVGSTVLPYLLWKGILSATLNGLSCPTCSGVSSSSSCPSATCSTSSTYCTSSGCTGCIVSFGFGSYFSTNK